MSSDYPHADAPRYPIVSGDDATRRADLILADFDLATDVGLEDRLAPILGTWMDEHAVSYLTHEIKHLYWLLIDPRRTRRDKPIDAEALRRALVLAMSRPAEDECWRDYQRIQGAVYQRWLAVGALLRSRGLRSWLLRRKGLTDEEMHRRESEWQRPIAEARAHFIATWRH